MLNLPLSAEDEAAMQAAMQETREQRENQAMDPAIAAADDAAIKAADTPRSRPFARADQESLDPGYYWIRRNEPDGPPEWEVARFTGEAWYTTGNNFPKQPTRDPNASNAWKIGPRVEYEPPS